MSREIVDVSRFLEAPELDRPKQDVPVPELGNGAVIPVWGMLPSERTKFEEQFALQTRKGTTKTNRKKTRLYRELLLVECCRNDDGSHYFEPDHIEKIGTRSGIVVERLFNAAMELSGISSDDLEAAVGNSDGAQGD